jgi:hypothetical protein
LPYSDWAETCSALHLWAQIVGKYRLAHTPWVNHSWHATLYVTPRGLTTRVVPDGKSAIALTFDFHDHALIGETADMRESFPLEAMSVADFLSRTTTLVERLGGRMDIHGTPNEIPNAKSAADNEVARKRTVAGSREGVFACLHMANPRLVCRIGYGFGAISPRGRQPQKS